MTVSIDVKISPDRTRAAVKVGKGATITMAADELSAAIDKLAHARANMIPAFSMDSGSAPMMFIGLNVQR